MKRFKKVGGRKMKGFSGCKSRVEKDEGQKSKLEESAVADIENLLIEHNITAASYHGGKLHGVHCQELIFLSKVLLHTICSKLRIKHGEVHSECPWYYCSCCRATALPSRQ
jgi:hypothetical protein